MFAVFVLETISLDYHQPGTELLLLQQHLCTGALPVAHQAELWQQLLRLAVQRSE